MADPAFRQLIFPARRILQYSSGSTRLPTGVMISHRNLQVNFEQLMRSLFAGTQVNSSTDLTIVSWLPFYHDMGLVLGRLRTHPGRLSRRADEPDCVPGKAGQVDASAG